jgi:adenylyltransferase/sulfurtransferase
LNTADTDRYRKQILLRELGHDGQKKLSASKAVVMGCGALGSVISSTLTRMGVGTIIIADRDYIETDNLHRQILFDEDDVKAGHPKAVAAALKLKKINSSVKIEPLVTDIRTDNIEEIIAGADCVVDGTDNFETRFLINDACYKLGIPWVYGGVVGTSGMTCTILPDDGPCFRCFLRDLPPPGTTATCDTSGVLATAVSVIASIEATEAVKILSGRKDQVNGSLITFDIWSGSFQSLKMKRDKNCPLCAEGRYDFLHARTSAAAVTLCGRNAVQISPAVKREVNFDLLASRLRAAGSVTVNEYILKFSADGYEISMFKEGRAIIKGARDETEARVVMAKYIGQ